MTRQRIRRGVSDRSPTCRPPSRLISPTGFSHAYKRHGTTTLFAALDTATGLVKTGHYRRRRRVEFLDFMNRLVAEQAGREIHVILDNLNTHKPKHDRWEAWVGVKWK